MDFKLGLFIAFAIAAAGCETGACYYTCCEDPADEHCAASCDDNSKSAETCAADAQKSCEASGGTIEEVAWEEINDLYCDSCSDFACAPQWWTEDRLADENDDTATSPDGGA